MFQFLRTDAKIGWKTRLALSSVLFVALLGVYVYGAHERHAENPDDKVMPTLSQMVDGIKRVALERDRDGEIRLWVDTWASARRFGIALAIIFLAILNGLNMGCFPFAEALLYKFIVFFDKIPALSLLPILFIREFSTITCNSVKRCSMRGAKLTANTVRVSPGALTKPTAIRGGGSIHATDHRGARRASVSLLRRKS